MDSLGELMGDPVGSKYIEWTDADQLKENGIYLSNGSQQNIPASMWCMIIVFNPGQGVGAQLAIQLAQSIPNVFSRYWNGESFTNWIKFEGTEIQ